VILVTHEEEIAEYAHRIIRLRDGVVDTRKTNNYFTTTMKIAILTCDQLPNLNLADQPLIKELAKHNIVASPDGLG
jgi:homospermidine synthase